MNIVAFWRRKTVLIALLFVLVLVSGGLTLWALNSSRLDRISVGTTAGAPVRVLYIGDSLTRGLFASTSNRSFQMLVSRKLAVSRQVDSEVLAEGGLRVSGAEDMVQAAKPHAELAIIEVGTNDIGRTPVDAFAQQYSELLGSMMPNLQSGGLVCVGTWGIPVNTKELDAIIRRSCEMSGGQFVSISDLYISSALRGPANVRLASGQLTDNFHPNDAGHEAIFERIMAKLDLAD